MVDRVTVMSKEELKEYLGVGRDKLNQWIGEGLPFFRVGEGRTSPLRFEVGRVLDWLHENYGEGGESEEEEES